MHDIPQLDPQSDQHSPALFQALQNAMESLFGMQAAAMSTPVKSILTAQLLLRHAEYSRKYPHNQVTKRLISTFSQFKLPLTEWSELLNQKFRKLNEFYFAEPKLPVSLSEAGSLEATVKFTATSLDFLVRQAATTSEQTGHLLQQNSRLEHRNGILEERVLLLS